MKKNRDVSFKWQTMDEDEEADEPNHPLPLHPAGHRRRTATRIVLALSLVLLMAGGWRTWHVSQAGIRQIEQEVKAAAQADLWTARQAPVSLDIALPVELAAAVDTDLGDSRMQQAWQRQIAQEQRLLPAQLLAADGAAPIKSRLRTEVQLIALQDDVAAVKVVTRLKGQTAAVRQVRFYRRSADGWRRTAPVAALWGEPRRKETTHFVFRYRQRDTQTVATVAEQIDAIYTRLTDNFGVTQVGPDAKMIVNISVTTSAGVPPVWVNTNRPLPISSPAIYQAPLELPDDALLQQAIILPVINRVWSQAMEEHGVWLHWQQMFYGLRLWQLWDLNVPLAGYRTPVVNWQYQSVDHRAASVDAQIDSLPDERTARYAEFCTMHRLWMPREWWQIPLSCTEADELGQPGPSGQAPPSPQDPPRYLHQLTPWRMHHVHPPMIDARFREEAAALATLVDYAVQTYGRDRLPDLLAGLGQYDTWDTLLPAVYESSPHEFEAGWPAYLQAEYGIELEHEMP